MKKLLIIPVIFLASCSVHVSPQEWEQAIEVCGVNDGVKSIFAGWAGANEVICNNGAKFILSSQVRHQNVN